MSLRPFIPNGMNQSASFHGLMCSGPLISEASKVAVEGSVDMGVPAGAELTVNMRPSGSFTCVPLSALNVTSVLISASIGLTMNVSLSLKTEWVADANRVPVCESSDAATAVICVSLNPSGDSISNSRACTDGTPLSLSMLMMSVSPSLLTVCPIACSTA